jgi:hypothetical protein
MRRWNLKIEKKKGSKKLFHILCIDPDTDWDMVYVSFFEL